MPRATERDSAEGSIADEIGDARLQQLSVDTEYLLSRCHIPEQREAYKRVLRLIWGQPLSEILRTL